VSRAPGIRVSRLSGEVGAAALEFALVFPVLLLMIYGAIHYALIFTLSMSLTSAANEGARAAVAVDPEESDYETLLIARARAAVVSNLGWLTAAQQSIVLGTGGNQVSVVREVDATLGDIVRVEVTYPSYASQPLLPVFSFPVLGVIPPVPSQLAATAVLQL